MTDDKYFDDGNSMVWLLQFSARGSEGAPSAACFEIGAEDVACREDDMII